MDKEQAADEASEETAEEIDSENEITETEALEAFNKAYETLKLMFTEFSFDKLDKQVELLNGYANANI